MGATSSALILPVLPEMTTEMPPPFTTDMVTSVYVETTKSFTEGFEDTTTEFFTSESTKFTTELEGTTGGLVFSTTEVFTEKTFGPEGTSEGPEFTTESDPVTTEEPKTPSATTEGPTTESDPLTTFEPKTPSVTTEGPIFTTAEPCQPSMICPEVDLSSIVDLINAQSQTLQEILQLAQSNQARLQEVEQQIGNFSCQATINPSSEIDSNSTVTFLSSPIIMNDDDENEAEIIQAKRAFINDVDLLKATFPTFDDLETWDVPKVFEEIELCVTSALSNCYNDGGSQSLAKIGAMFPGVTDFATIENLISGYSLETQTWMVGSMTKQCSGQFSNAAGSANNKYKAVKTTNYQCVTYLEKMFHARLQEFGL